MVVLACRQMLVVRLPILPEAGSGPRASPPGSFAVRPCQNMKLMFGIAETAGVR
jgi:hypothetical protein